MTLDDEARYIALCKRIRDRCRTQEWFGPDGEDDGGDNGDHRYAHIELYRPDDAEPFPDAGDLQILKLRGCPYEWTFDPETGRYDIVIDREHDPLRSGFAYPPATEEQVRATEAILGHRLPPMLRMLYLDVANGGFGPAYGITGVRGGWTFQDDGHYETLDQWSGWFATGPHVQDISLADFDRDPGARFELELPGHMRPISLVPICYEGCGNDTCVDLETGRVYLAGCGGTQDAGGNWSLYLLRRALSVEEWLELWLHDNAHYRAMWDKTD